METILTIPGRYINALQRNQLILALLGGRAILSDGIRSFPLKTYYKESACLLFVKFKAVPAGDFTLVKDDKGFGIAYEGSILHYCTKTNFEFAFLRPMFDTEERATISAKELKQLVKTAPTEMINSTYHQPIKIGEVEFCGWNLKPILPMLKGTVTMYSTGISYCYKLNDVFVCKLQRSE